MTPGPALDKSRGPRAAHATWPPPWRANLSSVSEHRTKGSARRRCHSLTRPNRNSMNYAAVLLTIATLVFTSSAGGQTTAPAAAPDSDSVPPPADAVASDDWDFS